MHKDLAEQENIKSKIYTIRGRQVMFDRDLAQLYGVETRSINQAVKRNKKRFPERFMFQLTLQEMGIWKSQIVISNKELMGLRKAPYAFTEQGVSMLSAVLKSDYAAQVSVEIMDAFVAMRYFITTNANIFHRIDVVERRQLEHKMEADKKFDQIFKTIEINDIKPKQGIFYDGQIFDAYQFLSKIIRSAGKSIVIIDNYIDETVLIHLIKRQKNVSVRIVTRVSSRQLLLDVEKFNAQYPSIVVEEFAKAHDRFIIIDNDIVYHFGASLKDLGKKWFAFTRMDIEAAKMLARIV
jgi:hypothetical protein